MSSDRKLFSHDDEEPTNVGAEPQESTLPDFTLSGVENLEADLARSFDEATDSNTHTPHHSAWHKQEEQTEPGYRSEDNTEPREEDAKAFDEATRVMSAPFAGLTQRKPEEDTAKTRFADETTDKLDSRTPFTIKSQHSNPAIEMLIEDELPARRFNLPQPKRLAVIATGLVVLAALYFLWQPSEIAPETPLADVAVAQPPVTQPEVDAAPQPRAVQASQVETLLYQFHTAFHKTQTQVQRKTSP